MSHVSRSLNCVGLIFAGLTMLAIATQNVRSVEEPLMASRFHLRHHTSASASASASHSHKPSHRNSQMYRNLNFDHRSDRPQQMIATKPAKAVQS